MPRFGAFLVAFTCFQFSKHWRKFMLRFSMFYKCYFMYMLQFISWMSYISDSIPSFYFLVSVNFGHVPYIHRHNRKDIHIGPFYLPMIQQILLSLVRRRVLHLLEYLSTPLFKIQPGQPLSPSHSFRYSFSFALCIVCLFPVCNLLLSEFMYFC